MMVRKNYQPGERSVKDARNRQAGNGSKGKIKSGDFYYFTKDDGNDGFNTCKTSIEKRFYQVVVCLLRIMKNAIC